MAEKNATILLMATAPPAVVAIVAEAVAGKHPGARLTMLIKSSLAPGARAGYPDWDVMEYSDGAVAPWNKTLPPLDALRRAGADAVYYACNCFSPGEYANVELFGRLINPENCFAYFKTGPVRGVALPEDILSALKSGGGDDAAGIAMLYERNSIEYSIRTATATAGPRTVGLLLTSDCNYRCVMCPTHSDELGDSHTKLGRLAPEGARELAYERARNLVDELAASGVWTIALSGYGEPLMYKKLPELIAHISSLGLWCQVNTNGLLMNERLRDCFMRGNMAMISVSLNSHSPESYSEVHNAPPSGFQKVLVNTKALIETKNKTCAGHMRVGLSFIITSRNFMHVGDMLDVSEDTGADFAVITPAFFPGPVDARGMLPSRDELLHVRETVISRRSASGLDIVMKNTTPLADAHHPAVYYKQYPCYYGWHYIIVNPAGDVTPCCGCDLVLGNVYKNSFAEIWNGPPYLLMREKMISLPSSAKSIEGCGCFTVCPHVLSNKEMHERLHASNVADLSDTGQCSSADVET